MAKTIDISSKLTKERPKLKLAEDKVFEINNSKDAVLILNQKIEESDLNDVKQLDEILSIALGQEAVDEINKMNLPFSDYQTIFLACIAGMLNEDFEVVEARFQRARAEI